MKHNDLIKWVGQNVKARRVSKGLTQYGLGSKIGMAGRHVGFIERGEMNSTLKTLNKVSHGLGFSIRDLLPVDGK